MARKIMKLGFAVALVALVIAAAVVVGFLHQTMVLEWDFVMQRQIIAVQNGGRPAIRISGLSGHSALSVKDISVQRSGSAQLVIVRVFLARRGTTGNFHVDVPVQDGINEIRFGNQEALIWQRPTR